MDTIVAVMSLSPFILALIAFAFIPKREQFDAPRADPRMEEYEYSSTTRTLSLFIGALILAFIIYHLFGLSTLETFGGWPLAFYTINIAHIGAVGTTVLIATERSWNRAHGTASVHGDRPYSTPIATSVRTKRAAATTAEEGATVEPVPVATAAVEPITITDAPSTRADAGSTEAPSGEEVTRCPQCGHHISLSSTRRKKIKCPQCGLKGRLDQ